MDKLGRPVSLNCILEHFVETAVAIHDRGISPAGKLLAAVFLNPFRDVFLSV